MAAGDLAELDDILAEGFTLTHIKTRLTGVEDIDCLRSSTRPRMNADREKEHHD